MNFSAYLQVYRQSHRWGKGNHNTIKITVVCLLVEIRNRCLQNAQPVLCQT